MYILIICDVIVLRLLYDTIKIDINGVHAWKIDNFGKLAGVRDLIDASTKFASQRVY